MKILATGPSGPADELEPLRAAGHEVIVGRPLDAPARKAYTEDELIEAARGAHVILASHLETIGGSVLEAARDLALVIVPFIGTDKIDLTAARGELMDEEAVARDIQERWIAGAAIDAFAKEPLPPASPLREADPERVILTPHNVAHSEAGRRANLALAVAQILAVGRGEVPAHVVNPDAIPRWRRSP